MALQSCWFGVRLRPKVSVRETSLQERESASEVGMKPARILTVVVLLLSSWGWAQTKIIIPAGTPEDKALNDINQESAVEKKTAMLEEFVQKFSTNPQAVAYGNWQLSQLV